MILSYVNSKLTCICPPLLEQFGASRAYSMLQASLGDFDDFLKECAEDVVVLAHSHHWKGKFVNGKVGKLIYVNTGTWIDYVEEVRQEYQTTGLLSLLVLM